MAPSSPNGLWFTDNYPLHLGAASKKTGGTLTAHQSSRVRIGPSHSDSEGTLRLSSSSVSDQPRAAVMLGRRDLKRNKGEGAPLVDQDD